MTIMTVDVTQRLLPVVPPVAGSPALAAHLAMHPALTVPSGDDPVWGDRIRQAVAESGLLGRGGAGFPTGAKWNSASTGRRRAMVARTRISSVQAKASPMQTRVPPPNGK